MYLFIYQWLNKYWLTYYWEKAMAPHSSTVAWKIPMEEPGRLQSKGSLRVVHDWATSLSLPIIILVFHTCKIDLIYSCEVWWGLTNVGDLVAKSCLTLETPIDCSPPVSSVHRISQARIQELFAISFSKWWSQPEDQTWVSCIAGGLFTEWATREAVFTISEWDKNSLVRMLTEFLLK